MVAVRWAHRGEAPKVYPLFRALVEAEQAAPPGPGEFSRTWGRSFREGSPFRFAVAEADDKRLVGCMSLHTYFSTWKGQPAVSLQDFFVAPDARGQGIGTAMLAFADAHAASLGAARLELDVRVDNEGAQRLYQRSGYEEQPYRWYHKGIAAGAPAPPRREAPEKGKGAHGRPRGRQGPGTRG